MPDSNVHGANMGPIWGPQDPGGPHFGPTKLAIWDISAIMVCFQAWLNSRHSLHYDDLYNAERYLLEMDAEMKY